LTFKRLLRRLHNLQLHLTDIDSQTWTFLIKKPVLKTYFAPEKRVKKPVYLTCLQVFQALVLLL
jgi:hypothetical protein